MVNVKRGIVYRVNCNFNKILLFLFWKEKNERLLQWREHEKSKERMFYEIKIIGGRINNTGIYLRYRCCYCG